MEPVSILAILVLNAAVGVWQSRSAQDSLDALKKLQPDSACVVRNGEWYHIISTSTRLIVSYFYFACVFVGDAANDRMGRAELLLVLYRMYPTCLGVLILGLMNAPACFVSCLSIVSPHVCQELVAVCVVENTHTICQLGRLTVHPLFCAMGT